jgi:hypothetical protein
MGLLREGEKASVFQAWKNSLLKRTVAQKSLYLILNKISSPENRVYRERRGVAPLQFEF